MLVSLVPLVVPIPMMFLGLFTSGIQALIFATLGAAYIGGAIGSGIASVAYLYGGWTLVASIGFGFPAAAFSLSKNYPTTKWIK